jgi:hypothetical protein
LCTWFDLLTHEIQARKKYKLQKPTCFKVQRGGQQKHKRMCLTIVKKQNTHKLNEALSSRHAWRIKAKYKGEQA